MLGGGYTREALFECLANKLRLFFDFNSVLQHHHRDDNDALSFSESEKKKSKYFAASTAVAKSARTVSPCTPEHLQEFMMHKSGVMTGTKPT